MSTVLNVRLSNEDEQALRALADELGLTYSSCARMLMKEGLRLRQPLAQAQALLDAMEKDTELRLRLRRVVLANIT